MKFSHFGDRHKDDCGIVELMDELGKALAENKEMIMLGGGNPSHIPIVQDVFRQRMEEIMASDNFETLIGDYDGPKGHVAFRVALAKLLKDTYNWDLSSKNIGLTLGSQSAFFSLFNLFGGTNEEGHFRQILLPLVPEYIGYADAGIEEGIFKSIKPEIEYIGENRFKYHIDFSNLEVNETTAAICVSRPTNPTGNVLTDQEMDRLATLAEENDIPLIIDNAYGLPFPSIIFNDAKPLWNENIILCLSLSKLGLPGTRTGIVVASEEVINRLASFNAVMNLAPGSLGPELVLGMAQSGDLVKISEEKVQPYYQGKAQVAMEQLDKALAGTPYRIHQAEGALFLWLWFEGLPISSQELYERLKKRNVLVVSGHHFFPGFKEEWQHQNECIRMTYSSDADAVAEGIKIIAEEVKKAYAGQ